MANLYQKGDRVKISTSTVFQDSAGTEFSPSTVTFDVIDPSGTTTSYISGTHPNVTNPATGSYICEIDVEINGYWHYRIYGEQSGENRGAYEGYFEVHSNF